MMADPKEWETYEEERRIFYVGITRAKNGLFLLKTPACSTFYKELEPKEKREQGATSAQVGVSIQESEKNKRGTKNQKDTQTVAKKKKFSEKEYKKFCDSLGEGIAVVHKKYGWGIVAEASPDYLVISFHGETKTFLLRVLFENELLKVE